MEPVGGRAYFRCAHCNTFEFPEATDDGIVTIGEPVELDCPVCATPLATGSIDGHPVSVCGLCRGFLAANHEFNDILPRRRAQCADRPSIPQSLDRAELARRVACPKCAKTMDTHPYGGGGNVVVDSCSACHLIWLDAGELETLARHRPKVPTMALAGAGAFADNREPEAAFRWGGESEEHGDGQSLWSLLAKLLG
jgi:Zn-finger nucleic acid-binding protein